MLGIERVCGVLALCCGVAVAVNCGGGDSTGTGGTGGAGGATSSSVSSSESSSSSSSSTGSGGMTCGPTEGTAYALTKLNLGEGNNGQWKKIGFDLDGQKTIGPSTTVCKPNAGANPELVYPDGVDGIDNSFGENLLPTIIGVYPTWPPDVNKSITNGDFNTLLKLYCLPEKGDDPDLLTKLFGGAPFGDTPPTFDGTDKWPVSPELLSDLSDPESSTIEFKHATLKGNLFDSGKNATFILTVPMQSTHRQTSIKLTLHAAHVQMTLSKDRKSATGGVIGGVLNTEEFVDEVRKIGWVFDLCENSVYDDILTQVRQASDIMTNGTQDPDKTCDGISIGVGFEMKAIELGDVGMPAEVGMACPVAN